jgi:hypothetical protein
VAANFDKVLELLIKRIVNNALSQLLIDILEQSAHLKEVILLDGADLAIGLALQGHSRA